MKKNVWIFQIKPEEELEKPLGRGKIGVRLQWVGDMGTLQM